MVSSHGLTFQEFYTSTLSLHIRIGPCCLSFGELERWITNSGMTHWHPLFAISSLILCIHIVSFQQCRIATETILNFGRFLRNSVQIYRNVHGTKESVNVSVFMIVSMRKKILNSDRCLPHVLLTMDVFKRWNHIPRWLNDWNKPPCDMKYSTIF